VPEQRLGAAQYLLRIAGTSTGPPAEALAVTPIDDVEHPTARDLDSAALSAVAASWIRRPDSEQILNGPTRYVASQLRKSSSRRPKLPFPWRRRLARDGALLSNLTRIFVETVHAFYAERAAREGALGAKTDEGGAAAPSGDGAPSTRTCT
jgi:hypothetical protein